MRSCEHKLRSIEIAPWKGHLCCPVSPGDSGSVGPGGGASAKEETRGRCDSMKVTDGLVCKTFWRLSESLSKQGGRRCHSGADGAKH